MSSSYIGSFLTGQILTELQVALDAEKAKTATLQTWANDRVKYAYPNGGSEGDEKALAVGSVYHLSSPFAAGVKFSATSEYFSTIRGEWIEHQKSFFTSDGVPGGYGTLAFPRSSVGMVVVTTGTHTVAYGGSEAYGGGWGKESAGSAKWRVRCARED
ncbi:hypothetical protein [Marinomonas primoryensis]|uniref:hypothetical protein n=1 Tax=Marinomonas primoryensis TaxID=178399 RepID=UPI0030DAA7D0|tara:strand:- start:2022 stop:2495 length:474 start_codon:yes stop_codon:yes gene_type:complete